MLDSERARELGRRSGRERNRLLNSGRAVSKFLSDHLGDIQHPFRRQVVSSIPSRPEPDRVVDLPVDLFWKIVQQAPDYVQPSYVLLVATGMDVSEYLATTETDLLPLTYAVRAHGAKTDVRDAVLDVDPELWPWIKRAVPAPVQYKWLRIHWKRALEAAGADTSIRLEDLRHGGGQWAAEHGAAEADLQVHVRHTSRDTTRRYLRRKIGKGVATKIGNAMLQRITS